MKIRDEINKYAKEENKPVLNWLLDNYSWSSQWRFVANCELVKYGTQSYQAHKVWSPTPEGMILYKAAMRNNNQQNGDENGSKD